MPSVFPINNSIISHHELLHNLLKLKEKYGGIFKTKILGKPTIFISDFTVLENILNSTKLLDKSPDYRFLHNWLGTGLLTAGGDKWKKHRKMLTPVFHFQILEEFVDHFNVCGNNLIQKLSTEVDKECVDIYPYITLCSLDIICATTLGSTLDAQSNSKSDYVLSVKEVCRILVERSTSLFKQYNVLYAFSNDFSKERKALKVLHGYSNTIITRRKAELLDIPVPSNSASQKSSTKRRKNLLDLLLEYQRDGQQITDKEIGEEVATFMFAGHDTTASAIGFALYCIANNPGVQEKIVHELETIFTNMGQTQLTYRNLQDMKYMELVIKETLRLYPSVPIYARTVKDQCDAISFPKGTSLVTFAYGIHRSAENYPDPERFDPERFLPDIHSIRSPYAYLPFSAGPRNCIGQKFAMLEMKAVISKIMQKFELLPTIPKHKLVLAAETVLKSKNGICIRLKRRNVSNNIKTYQ